MDAVQTFVLNNQHQLGYIMQEASRQWSEKDPKGALTVGECNVFIEKYGQYHEVLEKMQRYKKALEEISDILEGENVTQLIELLAYALVCSGIYDKE